MESFSAIEGFYLSSCDPVQSCAGPGIATPVAKVAIASSFAVAKECISTTLTRLLIDMIAQNRYILHFRDTRPPEKIYSWLWIAALTTKLRVPSST